MSEGVGPTHIEVLGAVEVRARGAALVAAVAAVLNAVAQAGRAGHAADAARALGLRAREVGEGGKEGVRGWGPPGVAGRAEGWKKRSSVKQ